MKSKQLYFLAAVLLLTACGAMNLTPEARDDIFYEGVISLSN